MRPFVSQSSQWIRAYYGGIGKTAVIYPAVFLVAVAMGQLTLGVVLYARLGFEASRTHIGVLAGSWSATYVVGCLLLRPLFSRVLPRYLIMASTVVMAILILAMAAARSFGALFPLYTGLGLVLSLFWPPIMGWLSTDSEGAQLGRLIGCFNLAWCSGAIISPFLCGWLSAYDPRYPLVLSSILLLLVFAFVTGASMVLPQVKQDRLTGARQDAGPAGQDRSCPLRYPAWMGLFGSFYAMGVVASVFPLVALDAWGMTETMIGAILTGRALSNGIGFILLARMSRWHFRMGPMLAMQWLAVAVFAGLIVFRSKAAVAVLMFMFGFSAAMSYASSLFHGAAGSLNRARRMAVHESLLAAGLLAGSISGGWLYDRTWMSAEGVFSTVSLMLAFLTFIQWIAGRALSRGAGGSLSAVSAASHGRT